MARPLICTEQPLQFHTQENTQGPSFSKPSRQAPIQNSAMFFSVWSSKKVLWEVVYINYIAVGADRNAMHIRCGFLGSHVASQGGAAAEEKSLVRTIAGSGAEGPRCVALAQNVVAPKPIRRDGI